MLIWVVNGPFWGVSRVFHNGGGGGGGGGFKRLGSFLEEMIRGIGRNRRSFTLSEPQMTLSG